MSLLKGNYSLEQQVEPTAQAAPGENLLEQDYYKAALSKLGGSICFVMKPKGFLWKGDEAAE